jgi:hypothetical protein
LVDAAVGGAAIALEAAAKVSVAAAPAMGCVYAPAGYVVNTDVLPVMLMEGPVQPAPRVHAEEHAGQFTESPNVVCEEKPPEAAHAATVTSVQELEPASELDPAGQAIGALEPRGQ